MLVELHVEASGAEVGTLQTPGRQFVRGREKPVEIGGELHELRGCPGMCMCT
jgi:hypothetical protein